MNLIFVCLEGRYGRSESELAKRHTHLDAGRLHHLHDVAGRRSHAGSDDQHVHPADGGRCVQSEQRESGARVAAREAALVHRDGVGLLHVTGPHPISVRDRHPVLGKVLQRVPRGCLGRLRCPGAGAGRLLAVRRPLLPHHGRAQVRNQSIRHSRAGAAEGADRGERLEHRAVAVVGHRGHLELLPHPNCVTSGAVNVTSKSTGCVWNSVRLRNLDDKSLPLCCKRSQKIVFSPVR